VRDRPYFGPAAVPTLSLTVGILDRLVRPSAARERRHVDAHHALFARELETYASLVMRSERVPDRGVAVPLGTPRAVKALKELRRGHDEFRAAWQDLDAARAAVRAHLSDPDTPEAAKAPALRRFRPLEARHPDAAAMRRRDKVWRSRIAQIERIADPAPGFPPCGAGARAADADPHRAFGARRRTAPRR
jgi:hypothetical protein